MVRKATTKRVRAAGSAALASAKAPQTAKASAPSSSKAPREVARYVAAVAKATPMQRVELERSGVPARVIKELSTHLQLPTSRMFHILGVPKATAEKKAAAGENVAGSAGYAAMGMATLLATAQDIASSSTAVEAKGFDAGEWLGRWIELPQAALGGRRPSELLDTATGVEVVTRLLGSLASGAFQ